MTTTNGAAVRAARANRLLDVLTRREREVLDRLARGLQNKAIARDLGISPRTVEVHRANLLIKLDVRRLSAALRLVLAAGRSSAGFTRSACIIQTDEKRYE